jgi:Zn-finger nucleic acid-binding protein
MGQVEGFRQYVCAGCGGVVIGIAVLRQLSGPLGQHIWTAEPVAPSPGTAATPVTCPFCSTAMTLKAVSAGSAATCRACEIVWLDQQAAGSLPVRAAGPQGQPTLETQPTLATQSQAARCQQCGAPVLHTWDERCQYCGAALHAPTQVVVLQSDAPEEENSWDRDATGRRGLFGDVIGMLSRPVD